MTIEDKYRSDFYLQAISSQDMLLQSYRALFLTLEAALLGLAFFLDQSGRGDLTFPALAGMTLGLVWILVCSHRGYMIDRLKEELKNAMEGRTDNLKGWFDLSYGGGSSGFFSWGIVCNLVSATLRGPPEKYIPRLSFNLIAPAIVIVIWVLVWISAVWDVPPPTN